MRELTQPVPPERPAPSLPIDRVLDLLVQKGIEPTPAKSKGKYPKRSIRCPVPSHGSGRGDRTPSAFLREGKGGTVYFECLAHCTEEEFAASLGLTIDDLRPNRKIEMIGGCTLEQYAAAKKLPVNFLVGLGLTTRIKDGAPAVTIPHYNEVGTQIATMFRLQASPRVTKWKTGDRAVPYGLNRIRQAEAAGRIVVVEGQSDTQTLWLHGEQAIGLPGSGGWNAEVETALENLPVVYVAIEPDGGGRALRDALKRSRLRDRVRLVRLDCKDPSELHVRDPKAFPAAWGQALERATRLVDELSREAAERLAAARLECAGLLACSAVLLEFEKDLGRLVAGEQATGKITFLAMVSRRFEKPVSLLLGGPAAAGKSYTSQQTLRFFPESTYHPLTGMSPRAPVFHKESFEHRHLVIFEADAIADEYLSYLLRSLLSEGCIRYDITEQNALGQNETRTIVKPGPTGVILTSTKLAVEAQMDTRLLAITADDSKEQTAAVMQHIADAENAEQPEFGRWHALQDVIEADPAFVTVPFARDLARLTQPDAVRLRRDFSVVLTMIRAHALLHVGTRRRDSKGRIIATLEDYRIVRELIGPLVAEGVGASVSTAVRETTHAVERLAGEDGCSLGAIADELKIDKSSASRRVGRAVRAGHVKNLEEKRGRPGRYVPDAPLTDGADVLPTVEQLEEAERVRQSLAKQVVTVFDGEVIADAR
jgi:hypothetical protein